MSERRLLPVPVATPGDTLELLAALRPALSGQGPALLPHLRGQDPGPAVRPGEPLDLDEDDPHDPTVAVVLTSGSTGPGRGVLLNASALLASASATHDRLGGPGHWLLALPVHHVAGLQVLVRSVVGRTTPQVLDLSAGFRPEAFAAAVEQWVGSAAQAPTRSQVPRRYTALVPTQLQRLLDAGGAAVHALTRLDAVLVGGGAAPPVLLARARAAGVTVVTTYGMTETCGGCVYDGTPLDGVQLGLEPDSRILLGGPVVARGYRRAAADGSPVVGPFRVGREGVRWYRTDDAGRLGPDGALEVLGRLDDAITTGGLTVTPSVVEDALARLPAVAEAAVVGVPDPVWGQRVVAVLVIKPGSTSPPLPQLRELLSAWLEPAAAPRQVVVVDELPLRGPGKPDRVALVALAQADAAQASRADGAAQTR